MSRKRFIIAPGNAPSLEPDDPYVLEALRRERGEIEGWWASARAGQNTPIVEKKRSREERVYEVHELVDVHDMTGSGLVDLESISVWIRGRLISRSNPKSFPKLVFLKNGEEIELTGPYDHLGLNISKIVRVCSYYLLLLEDVQYYDQTIVVYAPEELKDKVLSLRFGEIIKVRGVIREIMKANAKIIRYFLAFDIEREERKVTVEPEEEEMFREKVLKELNGDPDAIADYFFPNIYGLEDFKLSCLATAISGGARIVLGGVEKNGAIHSLVISRTGGAKSLSGDRLETLFKGVAPFVYADRSKATTVGLIGGVDTIEGERVIRIGLLPQANGGMAIIDELDKIDDKDDLAGTNTVLSDGRTAIAKATRYMRPEAMVGVLAFANLFNKDKLEKRLSSIGLTESLRGHESFYDRFSIILYLSLIHI